MLKLIDAHAHLNFTDYDADRGEVIARAREEGLGMINVGTDLETSRQVVELAKNNPDMWATIGLHPTDHEQSFDREAFLSLAREERVVAIGECGLDYFRSSPETAAQQQELFIKQIELANEVGKPLMLHIRNAYQDAYELVKAHAKVKGDVHFFAGNWEEAKLFLDLGFTLSFTGVITFANSYDEVIKNVPLDMILAETDCPFVAPAPYRGKRNEPSYVQEVVKRLAEIKGLRVEELSKATLANTARVFGLGIA
jgi:TatD DNase family protein